MRKTRTINPNSPPEPAHAILDTIAGLLCLPMLVRGSKWGEATEAYLHRSPLIGPGQFRLVLKVDEVREDGPAPWQSA